MAGRDSLREVINATGNNKYNMIEMHGTGGVFTLGLQLYSVRHPVPFIPQCKCLQILLAAKISLNGTIKLLVKVAVCFVFIYFASLK